MYTAMCARMIYKVVGVSDDALSSGATAVSLFVYFFHLTSSQLSDRPPVVAALSCHNALFLDFIYFFVYFRLLSLCKLICTTATF